MIFDLVKEEFGLVRRSKPGFNETIKETLDDRRVFNSKYLYRVPEDMKKNIDFFASLMIVGITPMAHVIKPVFARHDDRFHLLQGVVMRGTHKVIVNFDVPEVNEKLLHANVANKIMSYDGVKVIGRGDRLLHRAREDLGGERCIVFGVNFGTEYHYYMWDVDSIYRVDASGPAIFERCGETLYLLSDVKNYHINIDYVVHDWEILSDSLIDAADKGIVVNIDMDEYKIPKVRIVVVEVEDGQIKTQTEVIKSDVSKEYKGNYEMKVQDFTLLQPSNRKVVSQAEYIKMKTNVFDYSKIKDNFYVRKVNNVPLECPGVLVGIPFVEREWTPAEKTKAAEEVVKSLTGGDDLKKWIDVKTYDPKVPPWRRKQARLVNALVPTMDRKGRKVIPVRDPPLISVDKLSNFMAEANKGVIYHPGLMVGHDKRVGARMTRIRRHAQTSSLCTNYMLYLPFETSWRKRDEYWNNGVCYFFTSDSG